MIVTRSTRCTRRTCGACFHFLWGGTLFPRTRGVIPEGQPTPVARLDLQAGELVRVKSHEAILHTISTANQNRGLSFDAEMVPYCGGTYRVQKRVRRLIDERSGEMRELKTPSLILESVVCQSRYSECRYFCPRSIHSYWREIWLERVESTLSPRDAARKEKESCHFGLPGRFKCG